MTVASFIWHQKLEKQKKKLDFFKIKTSVLQRILLRKWKDNPQTGRNIFANQIPVKGLVSKIQKYSYNSVIKKTNILL